MKIGQTFLVHFLKIPLKISKKNINEVISINELEEINLLVKSMSFEDRIFKLQLNADRADVIIPAINIYLKSLHLFVNNLDALNKNEVEFVFLKVVSYVIFNPNLNEIHVIISKNSLLDNCMLLSKLDNICDIELFNLL